MLMVRHLTPIVRRRRFIESFRFQLVCIALVAVLAPLLVPYLQFGGPIASLRSTQNSQVASFFAAISALFAYRRVTLYPGTMGFAYILPSFLVTYGVAAAVMLGFRLSYSTSMLVSGFLFSAGVLFIVRGFGQRGVPLRFYIIPGSEGAIVPETPRVEWITLSEPTLPPDPSAIIVADLHADNSGEWERLLATAAISGHPVYHTKQLRESLTGRVQIEHLSENSFGSLLPNLAYRKAKRLIDLTVSLAALPFLVIPMVVVAITIKLDSAGPIFFRQQRMGYRGAPFQVFKFRTMRHTGVSGTGDEVRRSAITETDDHRITRVGRVLRRLRVDEVPQVLNVIAGQMSIIGPRPEAVPLSHWYESELPFYVYRHIVRPGITGWAQVNQGHVAALDDVHTKLHFDFYYIKNFSAWLDILIAMRTIGIVLTGFGAK